MSHKELAKALHKAMRQQTQLAREFSARWQQATAWQHTTDTTKEKA